VASLVGLLAAVVRDSLYYSYPGLMALYGACGGGGFQRTDSSLDSRDKFLWGAGGKIYRGGMKSPPTPQGV